MNIHRSLVVVLGLILISSTVSAATCRAGNAAQAGSNVGYERVRAAVDAWSQRENDVSSSLQPCLSRIKKIGINLPWFPSLDGTLSQLENQVCDAVVDKVNEKLPGNIDPWKDYNLQPKMPSHPRHHIRHLTRKY